MTDEAKVLCEPFKFEAAEKKKCSDHIQRHFRQQGTFKGKTAAATIRLLRVCVRKTLTDLHLALTLDNAFCDKLEHQAQHCSYVSKNYGGHLQKEKQDFRNTFAQNFKHNRKNDGMSTQ